jgi:hypothetical protein
MQGQYVLVDFGSCLGAVILITPVCTCPMLLFEVEIQMYISNLVSMTFIKYVRKAK